MQRGILITVSTDAPHHFVSFHLMILKIVAFLQLVIFVASDKDFGYSVVIDAGSSGSRVHIYKLDWTESKQSQGQVMFPNLELPEPKLKTKPGLSSFALHPDAAGESLSDLIAFAVQHVPKSFHSSTPVYLSATAGLRLVEKDVAERILDSCYNWLSSKSPFLIRREKISVISGRDEGAFGWLTMNFLQKRLFGMPLSSQGTLGTIEMGGASTQVTFLQSEGTQSPDEYLYELHLGLKKYQLYTHSYLGFGQDQGREKYNKILGERPDDPCFPVGYFRSSESNDVYQGRSNNQIKWRGSGSFQQCASELKSLFAANTVCPVPPCSFADVHQPRFWEQASNMIVLIENFYHTSLVR